jgi:hypothetical protein
MELKNIVKATCLLTSNGTPAHNQLRVQGEDFLYFKSYDSIVVFIDKDKKTFIDEKTWKATKTTSIYRMKFLGETLAETTQKINAGIYQLANLNP